MWVPCAELKCEGESQESSPLGGCKVILWTWLCGKLGWCSAPIFNMTNPSLFQDAPAMCWEHGRTCPAMTRRGGASACPTWWGATVTSVRASTGTWAVATAASPVTATRTAPAAPAATRYHQPAPGILRAHAAYPSSVSFHFPAFFRAHTCKLALLFPLLGITQSIKGISWVAPLSHPICRSLHKKGCAFPSMFCSYFPFPMS